jgi:hypothetical protein
VTQADDAASRDEAADVGLALLLGSGVAEAMAVVEATLASVQGAASRAFAGLAQVQAAGAAATSVPPVVQPAVAGVAPPVVPPHEQQARPAERLAPPPAPRQAGAEQVAASTPVSVPGEGVAVLLPVAVPRGGDLAAFAPAPALANGGMAPAPAPTPGADPAVSPTLFAAFAPPVPLASGMETSAVGGAGGQGADVPGRRLDEGSWAPTASLPVAPMAAPTASAGSPRANAPRSSQAVQGGPTGGDVFLDGVRVGTWLADHMARETGRPQMGGTAFDPRLTPAWPGTLQGS